MPGMKTIAEIRLENLERLIEEFDTADAVAEMCGTSAVYLSQIRNQARDSKTKKPRQPPPRTSQHADILSITLDTHKRIA